MEDEEEGESRGVRELKEGGREGGAAGEGLTLAGRNTYDSQRME